MDLENINLRGFHAVITGGSSGLGFEMAKTLASHGATVAIAARPGERLERAYKALSGENRDVHALAMDVRDAESVRAAAKWIDENWQRLDMLVNNAGVGLNAFDESFATNPGPFYEIPTSVFYNIVETNFIGYFHAARAFVPLMLKKCGGGRLVNVSTSIRTMTARGQLPYGPARAAAEAMSVILTEELRDSGVTVNVLLPGGAADTGLMHEAMRDSFRERGLLPPDIMNEAILFLASPMAEGMTGERIIGTEFRQWLADKGYD